ncbi:MAG: N-acetyltransferase [Rhodobacteraceae bacterium]|nr:N-acetyltransferase [Paracoccaceae bacterium]
MSVEIRPARQADATAICAIWNAVIRDTLTTFTTEEKTADRIAAEIAARGPAFLVARDGDAVVGFATCFAFRPGPGYAFTREHSVHVAAQARRRGIGQALMAQLETEAAGQGVRSMIAGISDANPGGIAFHDALGYRPEARLPQVGFKAGQWLDLVLMQKFLEGAVQGRT